MAQEDWSDMASRDDNMGFGETLDQRDMDLNEELTDGDRMAIAGDDQPETSYEAGFGEDIKSFDEDEK